MEELPSGSPAARFGARRCCQPGGGVEEEAAIHEVRQRGRARRAGPACSSPAASSCARPGLTTAAVEDACATEHIHTTIAPFSGPPLG